MDLPDKDFKAPVLQMFKELKEDSEKVKNAMYEQNGNIHKEKENIKRNQIEILELNSTIIKTKNKFT